MDYRIVIGLEVHVQLLTRTKLFCGCSTRFGQPPNTQTCPICIGMPGVLPVMNRRAYELGLKAALALNCRIAGFTKWDRKNYYYPDLPKNYQISQYDLPFSHDGWLEIETDAGVKKVGIIRAHLEEDAGKMLHDEEKGQADSLVDLNRTGTPLLEIVSQPDMSSPEEAGAYLTEIRLLMRELEVSDCEMQEGSLRCDANVNIHIPQPGGKHIATPVVEIKNLNSIGAVERAIASEATRHYEVWKINPKFVFGSTSKLTRGWDEKRRETYPLREKEEAADYRYFPEPDLVPVTVTTEQIETMRASLGELPSQQVTRLQSQYGLSHYDARVLAHNGRAFVAYFEAVAAQCGDAKEVSNWLTNSVLATLNERKISIKEFSLPPAALSDLIQQKKKTGLNPQRTREVYAHMLEKGVGAAEAVNALGFKSIDGGQLTEMVRRAIAGNPKAVADFKKGKVKAADAIKGAVMRETKGQANTEALQQLVMEELQKA